MSDPACPPRRSSIFTQVAEFLELRSSSRSTGSATPILNGRARRALNWTTPAEAFAQVGAMTGRDRPFTQGASTLLAKPFSRWLLSQNGFLFEPPQRQSEMRSPLMG